jgi:hypothetical protein
VNRYEAQVAAALGAVQPRPPDAFLWFGRRESVGPGGLVDSIAERLRGSFFSTATPQSRASSPVVPGDGGAFVRALSQANSGRGAWQAGWHVAAREEDDTLRVLRPDGLALLAPAEQVRTEGDAVPGAAAHVLMPKELRGLSPGFCIALGDSGAPDQDERAALYWNVAAAGAGTLVARVTHAFNGAGLPFSLELPDDHACYGRGDAALLLVARTDFPAAMKLLRPLLRALGPHLAEPAPAFCRPLARGLAVAEQPPGVGFGAHRCGLLAEAIVAAAEAGARTIEERLAVAREHFAAARIDLHAPYLQPGSADAYS